MCFTFRENWTKGRGMKKLERAVRCKNNNATLQADAVTRSVRPTLNRRRRKINIIERCVPRPSVPTILFPFISAHPLCLFRFQIHRASSRRIHCHSLATPYCLFNVQAGEKSFRGCHRWILHGRFDGNARKEPAAKLALTLNFKVKLFSLYCALLVTKVKLVRRNHSHFEKWHESLRVSTAMKRLYCVMFVLTVGFYQLIIWDSHWCYNYDQSNVSET